MRKSGGFFGLRKCRGYIILDFFPFVGDSVVPLQFGCTDQHRRTPSDDQEILISPY